MGFSVLRLFQPSKTQFTDPVSRLRHDRETKARSDDAKIPKFVDTTVVDVYTSNWTTRNTRPTHVTYTNPHNANEDDADDTSQDKEDLLDEEYFETDAIDLWIDAE